MSTRMIGSARVAAVLGLLAVAQCQNSDRLPPKGATITVAATPTTIPTSALPQCISLLGSSPCGTAQVIAGVSSDLGVPLPGQDVRFSSTAGLLFTGSLSSPVPASNIPIRTDQFGNATVNLITSTTSTVTARSGSASGTLTINTVQGNLSQITLNLDTTTCPLTTANINSCTQQVCLVASALDPNGVGVANVLIVFKIQNTTGTNTFTATFSPPQPTTENNGNAMTTLAPGADCSMQCTGNKCSGADVIATTQNGTFQSPPLHLNISIP